jgi:hypothetical protein
MGKRLIDANAADVDRIYCFYGSHCTLEDVQQWLDERPTVDAVEVVHGYNEGDVCFYGFHDENKSLALVEIVKILNDERGVAEVSFLKVFVDDTGNGMFDYLLRSGNRMNVSIKYLRNITPNFGAKMDGGKEK